VETTTTKTSEYICQLPSFPSIFPSPLLSLLSDIILVRGDSFYYYYKGHENYCVATNPTPESTTFWTSDIPLIYFGLGWLRRSLQDAATRYDEPMRRW
jgi:hypothetical protein